MEHPRPSQNLPQVKSSIEVQTIDQEIRSRLLSTEKSVQRLENAKKIGRDTLAKEVLI